MEELSTFEKVSQIKPIDRLFLRMASMYGKHWLDMWTGVPIEAVKLEWQEKLTGMSSKVVFKALDYCGENLKFPPTLPEFIQLCKASTPSEITRALPRHFSREELDANHERIKQAVQEVSKAPGRDYRKWARDIVAQVKAGKIVPEIAKKFAHEALGIKADQ